MYQVRIPLDIIWMDRYRAIVEIAANAPPCKTVASQCPHYGGNSERAQYVLELAGGMAAKYGLKRRRHAGVLGGKWNGSGTD